MNGFTAHDVSSQQGKTFLVTGANTGIGFEVAKALAEKGAQVMLGCRSEHAAGAATHTSTFQLFVYIRAIAMPSGQPNWIEFDTDLHTLEQIEELLLKIPLTIIEMNGKHQTAVQRSCR